MNRHYNLMVRNPFIMGASFIMIFTGVFWAWSIDPTITAENDLLEAGQAALLILACLAHGFHYGNSGKTLDRYLHFGLTLLCFGILLREFDIDKLGSSPVWASVETVVRAVAVITFLIYLILSLKKISFFCKNIDKIYTSPMILVTFLGCSIYMTGWLFDKMIFSIAIDLSVLFEETLELSATLLLFVSSTISPYTEEPLSLSPTKAAENHSL